MKNYARTIIPHQENEVCIVEDYVATIIYSDEPKNFYETTNQDESIQTMEHEFDSIRKTTHGC
jgi:hypothetical protein